MTPTEKECTRCGATKPLDQFPLHPECQYGRNSQCKDCVADLDYTATERKRRQRQREATRPMADLAATRCPTCSRPLNSRRGLAIHLRTCDGPHPGAKRCATCHEVKPHDQFHTAAHSPDGHTSSCRPCANAEQSRRRALKGPREARRELVPKPDLVRGDDWKRDAACRDMPPSIFYLAEGESAAPAKRVCSGCPVQPTCLEVAIVTRELGVWGGTTERERRILRRARAAS